MLGNSSTIMKKLGVLSLLALAAALSFFIVSFTAGNHMLDDHVRKGQADQKIVAELKHFIEENKVSSDDDDALYKWCSANRGVDIEVFVDGKLVFMSLGDVKALEEPVKETEGDRKKAISITFADTTADVIIYDGQRKYETLLVVNIVIALLLFVGLIIWGIDREVKYINILNEEIHVLEGGDLSKEITVRGNDEIAMLAESVNEFRKSMQNQLKKIEQLEKNNRMISAEIAHDLRTPLTSLIMYLDFALGEVEGREPQAEEYLRKARERSIRLKDLLDENFSYMTMTYYFLEEKQEDQAYVILNGFLSDLVLSLESQGFNVRSDINYGKSIIRIQGDAVGRIFGNLYSNIRKYAEKDSDVYIWCRDKETHLELRIGNEIRIFEGEKPESTGFGSRIVKRLMKEMDGEFYVEETEDRYTAVLRFPKVAGES